MKPLALLLALALCGKAEDGGRKAEVVRGVGKCQGGLRPSVACKTCEHCAYCGRDKGRGANSATCAVCAAAKSLVSTRAAGR